MPELVMIVDVISNLPTETTMPCPIHVGRVCKGVIEGGEVRRRLIIRE